jgi:two-component system phosphate regulon response regulator PhoB
MSQAVILVVEDNTDIRETVCFVLEENGYQTAGASNGQEAIDWLHCETAPSVILLDLTMPVMDGYEFLMLKEAERVLDDVPVVVMTAVGNCRPLLFGHQIFDCIFKPFSAGVLLKAIQRSARS